MLQKSHVSYFTYCWQYVRFRFFQMIAADGPAALLLWTKQARFLYAEQEATGQKGGNIFSPVNKMSLPCHCSDWSPKRPTAICTPGSEDTFCPLIYTFRNRRFLWCYIQWLSNSNLGAGSWYQTEFTGDFSTNSKQVITGGCSVHSSALHFAY